EGRGGGVGGGGGGGGGERGGPGGRSGGESHERDLNPPPTTAECPRMPTAVLADRADRILARLFPTRFRAAAPEGRHGRVGAPHLWRMQRAFQIDFLQRMGLAKEPQLLDLGCGTLRGGLPLIAHPSAGHYTGTHGPA